MKGSTRVAFLGYFLSHVPITLFVDAQGLLKQYYPKFLTDIAAWYCDLFGDILMKNAPSTDYAWFSSLIFCEILFQLPFFVVAIQTLRRETTSNKYPEWFRMTCIVYGTHVSTTLVPIIGAFVTSYEMTIPQKCATIASKYNIWCNLRWKKRRQNKSGKQVENEILCAGVISIFLPFRIA